MAAIDVGKSPKFSLKELGILPVEEATDIHPHTSYTDGELSLVESIVEAYQDNLYEKGAIEHGNPIDEDINHPTTFLHGSEWEDLPYTAKESYIRKFDNLREITSDIHGATSLTDADPDKIREDLSVIKNIHNSVPDANNAGKYLDIVETMDEKLLDSKNISEYGSEELLQAFERTLQSSEVPAPSSEDIRRLLETGRDLNTFSSTYDSFLDDGLNYSLVVPHGVELDYNPAIELVNNDKQEAVESYEDALIDFLKEAESSNSGYNYILLSSHHVNTPFRPRYVKKDHLFDEMYQKEIGDVLEFYREKEVTKINSLASKLSDMSIPEVSDELMDASERRDLENFIYGLDGVESSENWQNESFASETLGLSLDIARPGVFAVGAHPTIIERNEEFMNYFRREQIRSDLDDRLNNNIEIQDVDEFVPASAIGDFYPSKALEEFYRPMIEAAESEDNFVFEVNGKGIERQKPSIFWQMLDENLFGSDSHRPGEQPSRSKKFNEENLPGDTKFLVDKWISQLEDQN